MKTEAHETTRHRLSLRPEALAAAIDGARTVSDEDDPLESHFRGFLAGAAWQARRQETDVFWQDALPASVPEPPPFGRTPMRCYRRDGLLYMDFE